MEGHLEEKHRNFGIFGQFHIFCQIKRYTTSRPKTAAGMELYMLAKDLLYVNTEKEAFEWKNRFNAYG